MGEIRVAVKLTNAFDAMLARRGELRPEQIRTYVGEASANAGGLFSVVPAHVAQQLGATIRGRRFVEHADGRKECVGLTGPILFEILGRDTAEEALVLGDEVLIGHTVSSKLDLLPDFANRRLAPNPAHPDQPVSKLRRPKLAT